MVWVVSSWRSTTLLKSGFGILRTMYAAKNLHSAAHHTFTAVNTARFAMVRRQKNHSLMQLKKHYPASALAAISLWASMTIQNIARKTAEDAARLRQEFDDKLTRNANTLANAVSVNEINKVFAPIARELEVHRKDAESKGDTQRSRHLSSRLRRLTDIKNGRIAELNKSEEKA